MTSTNLRLPEPGIERAPSTARLGTGLRPGGVAVTIVVPTRHLAPHVDELIERIRRTMGTAGFDYEILFVDDSDDHTTDAIAGHVGSTSPVRLLHRPPGSRAGGRAGAVCVGLRAARGSHALCIDGDLQHPPELLAPMARVLVDGTADLVVGTRYLAGGGDDTAGAWRRLRAVAARDLTRGVLRAARATTDPQSGLFGLRRALVTGVDLHPDGGLALVEIMARSEWAAIAELPYRFGARRPGHRPPADGARCLRQIGALRRDAAARGRSVPIVGTARAIGVPVTNGPDPDRIAMVVRTVR